MRQVDIVGRYALGDARAFGLLAINRFAKLEVGAGSSPSFFMPPSGPPWPFDSWRV
jgi:hypothetical protein